MPTRRDIFTNKSIYHVFNKTIDHKNIFLNTKVAEMFLDIVRYYRSNESAIRYSHFCRLESDTKALWECKILKPQFYRVNILAYCLMPNHFHFLIQQIKNDGINRFMSNSLNSLTRYHNLLNKRKGPIFLTQFRSRLIVSREQLIHVSRYIHLNPYSSGVVSGIKELKRYRHSSFKEYLGLTPCTLTNSKLILHEFNNNGSRYEQFVVNNAEHQRTLEHIKHLTEFI